MNTMTDLILGLFAIIGMYAVVRWKSGEISTSLFLQIVTLQDLERRILDQINTRDFVMDKFRRQHDSH